MLLSLGEGPSHQSSFKAGFLRFAQCYVIAIALIRENKGAYLGVIPARR